MTADGPQSLVQVEGVVRWYDAKKGYGFLDGPDGQEVFVHFSVIPRKGVRTLTDGSRVIFDAKRGHGRWQATRVIPFDRGTGSPRAET